MKTHSLEGFLSALPFSFTDAALLKNVFVHKSFLNEKDGSGLESNERLEFLGDAILSNIISHMLFKRFPEIDEGELTRIRARLVNRHALARVAREIRLNEFLLMGKGERRSGGVENPTILAGVFEAFVAAVYFHHGFHRTFEYIEGLFSPLLEGSHDEPGHFDHKPRLQELSQKLFKEAPVYRVVRDEGPPHKKLFEVEVLVAGRVLGSGTASKKKEAEQAAAVEALKRMPVEFPELFPAADERDGADEP